MIWPRLNNSFKNKSVQKEQGNHCWNMQKVTIADCTTVTVNKKCTQIGRAMNNGTLRSECIMGQNEWCHYENSMKKI